MSPRAENVATNIDECGPTWNWHLAGSGRAAREKDGKEERKRQGTGGGRKSKIKKKLKRHKKTGEAAPRKWCYRVWITWAGDSADQLATGHGHGEVSEGGRGQHESLSRFIKRFHTDRPEYRIHNST